MKRGPYDPAPVPANLSRAERAILEAVERAALPGHKRADKRRDLADGISLGDLEIETGYEGDQLTRTLAIMMQKGLIHSVSQKAGSHYSALTLTKYFAGPARRKAAA
jgi:hypothetical protein